MSEMSAPAPVVPEQTRTIKPDADNILLIYEADIPVELLAYIPAWIADLRNEVHAHVYDTNNRMWVFWREDGSGDSLWGLLQECSVKRVDEYF